MRIFILQTVGGFSGDGDIGGGSLILAEFGQEWRKLGAEVYFITNSADQGSSIYRGFNKLYRVPSFGRSFFFDMTMNFFIQHKEIESIVRDVVGSKDDDSIVVASSPYPSDVLAALWVSRKLKLRSVVYFHHISPPPWDHPFKRGGLVRTTTNWLLNQVALTIAKASDILPSIFHSVEITRSGWKFRRGILEYQCAFPREVSESPRKEKIEACYIGRIAVNKGIRDLLLAWKKVVTRYPEGKLVIAGKLYNPKYGMKLSALRKQLHLENNVLFLFRHITDSEKIRLLRSCKLFTFPSYEEGWSLSVMESAILGTLPVTYNLVAYDYLGPNRMKIRTGDIDAFANAILELLDDEEKRLYLSALARDAISIFSMDSIARTQLKRLQQYVEIGRLHSNMD